jgi:hypothetical protein
VDRSSARAGGSASTVWRSSTCNRAGVLAIFAPIAVLLIGETGRAGLSCLTVGIGVGAFISLVDRDSRLAQS